MEEELVELLQAASKAADAAAVHVSGCEADESRCLDALKRLKTFPVTSQVLVSTQERTLYSLFLLPHIVEIFMFITLFSFPMQISP